MKIFVSGQIGDTKNVNSVQDILRQAGHEITHDWTTNENDSDFMDAQAKFDDPDEARKRAMNDLNGVTNSDVYILCTDNDHAGKGMYVELGAALASFETRGKPLVYLLGQRNHPSIFYWHPAIRVRGSVEEIIAEF